MGWKTGLEPATLGITIRCSNQLSYIHRRFQILSDLTLSDCILALHVPLAVLARPTGIEPATAGLEGRCSIRLSYRRVEQV